MRDRDRATYADLLERRYRQNLSIYRLQEIYHLGERSLYYRLEEALVALAHVLWAMEQGETEGSPSSPASREPSPERRHSRHLPPPAYTSLFGADQMLAQLLDWLNDPDGHWMISLDGMGGLGKTALAREAAGRLAETGRFAGIAWLTVRPDSYAAHSSQTLAEPALTCEQMLDAIVSQLDGVDQASVPMPAKRDRVRALLRAHPYLVVVDNLEMVSDCGDVLDLLWELSRPSKFLFTSRYRMELDIRPWSVLTVHGLTEPESLAFIRHEGRLRGLREVTEASDDDLRSIVAVTGGNPLAIKLVIGQLVHLPLSRVLSGLETAHPGTDAFYHYLYCASWDLLSAPAKYLLLYMARLPACGGTWEDLSTNSALSEEDMMSAMAELSAYSLVEAAGLEEKTYSIHPLTRHFVLGQAAQTTPPEAGS